MLKNSRPLHSAVAACLFVGLLGALATVSGVSAVHNRSDRADELSRKTPTLYVVGYAHLDTQWRWDYVKTIQEYIPNTMRLNFDLFEKYPHYVFNFSGANRYRMMKEYYPADYEKVKRYVAAGRWYPSGSSMEENDVNATSAESIIRQILYGTQYFRREFGKTSAEFMLPDCFGFPASLPSILAHCGLKGFSTQKLVWGSFALVGGPNSPEKTPVGVPFNVGAWEGPDGQSVIAALNPGDYGSSITYDLSKTPPPPPATPEAQPRRRRREIDWPVRIGLNGEAGGLFADYMYFGTGDIGGSPDEASVKLLEAIVTKSRTALPTPDSRRARPGQPQNQLPPGPEIQVGDGPVKVISATSDRMFLDIQPEQASNLPSYRGDLELTNHSAGSITSQAYMKRWNRKNEILADAVEVAREAEGSKFVQTIRLSAGDAGNRVEFRNIIDWMAKEAHLKAVFPLTVASPVATYNWDIGTIERSTDNPKQFEFPSHQWFDLTDRQSGSCGVTVLSDCKYGSDKPDDNTLRLTLIRTPGTRGGYTDQGTQDWGRHDFVYGIAGHAGDFRSAQTDWEAFRLNQPLVAFQSPGHVGELGRSFSLTEVSHSRIRILALKKAEESDEVVVRLVEMDGRPAKGVRIRMAAPVISAREITGAEMPVGEATVTDGAVVTDFSPFQVRSFALKIAASSRSAGPASGD